MRSKDRKNLYFIIAGHIYLCIILTAILCGIAGVCEGPRYE